MVTRDSVIRLFESTAVAAREIGMTRQGAQCWKGSAAPIPPDRVLSIVRALKGILTPYQIRPDIYPDPAWLPPDLRNPEYPHHEPAGAGDSEQEPVEPGAGETAPGDEGEAEDHRCAQRRHDERRGDDRRDHERRGEAA